MQTSIQYFLNKLISWMDNEVDGFDILTAIISKLLIYIETNVYHSCPYCGMYYIKSKSFPVNDNLFIENLMPSGRFIMVLEVCTKKKKIRFR